MSETVVSGLASRPTLFRRMRRFSPTPGRDAREDRLTECLAATFEAAPEAARFLVAEWFDLSPDGGLTVTTQRRVRPGERLDLELVFGSVNRPEVTVWLEAKVGAIPWRDQAARYLAVLETVPGDTRLSWLLPVGREVGGGSPDGVSKKSWQDLAVAMNAWLRSSDASTLNTYPARIVQEFVEHLEEEGLAVTHPLTSEDVAAVQGYQVAEKRIQELLRLARALVHQPRPAVADGRRPPAGLGFWEHVEPLASWAGSGYLEWRGTHDGLRLDPVGAFAIGAGASWHHGTEPSEREQQDWFERRYAQGFEYGASRHNMVYLLRYQSLSDLIPSPGDVIGSGIDDQARTLSSWALDSWAMLEADPLRR
jgi:hypothetical protein